MLAATYLTLNCQQCSKRAVTHLIGHVVLEERFNSLHRRRIVIKERISSSDMTCSARTGTQLPSQVCGARRGTQPNSQEL